MKSMDAELMRPVASLLMSDVAPGQAMAGWSRGVVAAITEEGLVLVAIGPHMTLSCEVLASALAGGVNAGDAVLLMMPGDADGLGVVIGRVVRHAQAVVPATVMIEATESLTLKCGDASVDLRADGKVMVRGEDVLLRAKGTQRIRAGNVAIN